MRAGVHTGEIEILDDDIAGAALQIAALIAAAAKPLEILVSHTVKDLVAGSGISFAARGRHILSGIADQWDLFAVTRL